MKQENKSCEYLGEKLIQAEGMSLICVRSGEKRVIGRAGGVVGKGFSVKN